MRTIGRKNRNLVRKITKEILLENAPEIPSNLENKVIEILPAELWDTWEMADQEIKSIIDDVLMGRI